jgi:pyruvate dehydrogenase E2 component (dihydrolipoamide acetyltransferase)
MSALKEVVIPDIGNYANVPVIEVNVQPGQAIQKEEVVLTLESDKAAMEIPAPFSGVVKEVKVRVGDKVSKNSLVLMMEVSEGAAAPVETPKAAEAAPAPKAEPVKEEVKQEAPVAVNKPATPAPAAAAKSNVEEFLYASPSVRRLARELGVELSEVRGTGRKGRILEEDVQNFVKARMDGQSGGTLGLPSMPEVDFSQFGETTLQPLSRIKKLSAANLHRNWLVIPHVTQFDEVDITELEAFRQENKVETEKQGYKLTPLVFLMKAVVKALQKFPTFNASLTANGEELVMKKYYHIGVAVDTPNGLVVPVIRDVDQKTLSDLAKELAEFSQRARAGKLTAAQMQGSCFSISSLGGIGGTAFTPIINAPDVAILGVSKSQFKPVYHDGEFVARLMLPLSLSYDHRVIDGAEAARFITYLNEILQDIRKILL